MKLKCPKGCTPDCDTPFFYPPSACGSTSYRPKLGVLSFSDGQPSNRWEDGIAGVPEWIIDYIRKGDDFPHCIECLRETRREIA